jgi:hypothetical protein
MSTIEHLPLLPRLSRLDTDVQSIDRLNAEMTCRTHMVLMNIGHNRRSSGGIITETAATMQHKCLHSMIRRCICLVDETIGLC